MNDAANERRPTVKQIYALAATLCERAGEQFPRTVGEASALLDRLRGTKEDAAA
jgi:hypothetical protein